LVRLVIREKQVLRATRASEALLVREEKQAGRARMDRWDSPETLVSVVNRDAKENADTRDRVELTEFLARKAQQASPELPAQWDNLAPEVPMVKPDPLASQATTDPWVVLVRTARKVTRVPMVRQVFRVLRVPLAQLARKACPDSPAVKALLVFPERAENLAALAKKVNQVQTVLRDRPAHLVRQDQRVHKVSEDLTVLLDEMALPDPKEGLDQKVKQASPDLPVQPASPVWKDRQGDRVCKETKVLKEHEETPVFRASQDRREAEEREATPDPREKKEP